jgi:lipopolysaccharide export system permease protein
MLKKIDRLVLGAFIGPFIITFSVVVFILLLQFLMKYLDELVGKGIGAATYVELLFYCSINMVTTALPLSILISSLITFGNLGEHHELTAIKSSGISLIRALKPIFIFSIVFTVISFFFNNSIVPKANLKFYSLLYDMRSKKASLNFKEGVFYEGIPGYRIKISKKYPDGSAVKGVVVYNHNSGRGNTDVIIADSGYFKTFNNDRYLGFNLFNGNSYSEYNNSDPRKSKEQFVVSSFVKSKMVFNLESFQLKRTQEQLFSNNRYMKSVTELEYISDSIYKDYQNIIQTSPQNLRPYYIYFMPAYVHDTAFATKYNAKAGLPLLKTLNKDQQKMVLSRALSQARSVKAFASSNKDRIKYVRSDANLYSVEKLKKYTFSVACIIMFLIGAPLGAIIKKGGLGLPILISIVFFIIFYVFSITGEKWAKEAIVPVFFGTWLANLILLPIGLFFMRQAWKDSRLLEADFYFIYLKKWFGKKTNIQA